MTFLKSFTEDLNLRWTEVDLLIAKAEECEEDPSQLDYYNAICRSTIVLIVAHLEGSIKEILRCLIQDLNRYSTFKQMPNVIKRTYCRRYLGLPNSPKDKNYEQRVKKLLEKFDSSSIEIVEEPFLQTSREDEADTGNPKPDVIQKIFINLGVDDIFSLLHESDLDEVFRDADIGKMIEDQRNHLSTTLASYPYSCTLKRLNLTQSKEKPKTTLWKEFLNQVNAKRHLIAHGNSLNNQDSSRDLKKTKQKIMCLQLALVEITASIANPTAAGGANATGAAPKAKATANTANAKETPEADIPEVAP